jgi:hypothetical protein
LANGTKIKKAQVGGAGAGISVARPADSLREWIRIAEETRPQCINLAALDALIQHQRQRLENLETDGYEQTVVPTVEAAQARIVAKSQQTATSKPKTIPNVSKEIVVSRTIVFMFGLFGCLHYVYLEIEPAKKRM